MMDESFVLSRVRQHAGRSAGEGGRGPSRPGRRDAARPGTAGHGAAGPGGPGAAGNGGYETQPNGGRLPAGAAGDARTIRPIPSPRSSGRR